MTLHSFRDEAIGVAFTIDERFLDVGFAVDQESPSAHLLASEPAEGWIAALAIVTVQAEPLPVDEWLELQLSRARTSFGSWSPEAHEMLVAPVAGTLAGRPAIHVRYRLSGGGAEDEPRQDQAGPVPASLVEHWTVLVEERRWLLAVELMVQPPERWDAEREALELPFRTRRDSGLDCRVPQAADDRDSHRGSRLSNRARRRPPTSTQGERHESAPRHRHRLRSGASRSGDKPRA